MNGEAVPQASAAGGQGTPKVWERPWTIDEMRKSAGNWSLASDAGVGKTLLLL